MHVTWNFVSSFIKYGDELNNFVIYTNPQI